MRRVVWKKKWVKKEVWDQIKKLKEEFRKKKRKKIYTFEEFWKDLERSIKNI